MSLLSDRADVREQPPHSDDPILTIAKTMKDLRVLLIIVVVVLMVQIIVSSRKDRSLHQYVHVQAEALKSCVDSVIKIMADFNFKRHAQLREEKFWLSRERRARSWEAVLESKKRYLQSWDKDLKFRQDHAKPRDEPLRSWFLHSPRSPCNGLYLGRSNEWEDEMV